MSTRPRERILFFEGNVMGMLTKTEVSVQSVHLDSRAQAPITANQNDQIHIITPSNNPNKRTLCAHPKANNLLGNASVKIISNEAIQSRISDCLNNQQPLVSFHSERGFLNCKHLIDCNDLQPMLDSKHQSLVHQCLKAKQKGQRIVIEHQDTSYYLSVVVDRVQDNSQQESVKLIKGALQLENIKNSSDQMEVSFIEFYPEFDGYALDSNSLLSCHTELRKFRQEKSFNLLNGQFSSAKGIGRSASLLVLDQFHELCQGNNAVGLDDKQVLSRCVMELIGNVRRSNNQAIPHDKQVNELIDACKKMYQKTRPQAEYQPENITLNSEVEYMPNLETISDVVDEYTDLEEETMSINSEYSQYEFESARKPATGPSEPLIEQTRLPAVASRGVINRDGITLNDGRIDTFVENFWDDPKNLDSLKEFFIDGLGIDKGAKKESIKFFERIFDKLKMLLSGTIESLPEKLRFNFVDGFSKFLCGFLENEKKNKKFLEQRSYLNTAEIENCDRNINVLSNLIDDVNGTAIDHGRKIVEDREFTRV